MAIVPSTLPSVLRGLTWRDFDPTKDCTSAGKLFGQMFSNLESSELSIYFLADFAQTCAPVSLNGVTRGQIVDFHRYSTIERNTSLVVLSGTVRKECKREFCRNLKWGGNPDLSGIGVLMAFAFQAIVTTLFVMVKLYHRYKAQETTVAEQPVEPTKTPSTIDRCLYIFWISALYFGLCVGIASVAINFIEKGTEHTAVFSLLGALFSTSVLLCLWPWYRQIKSLASHLHITQCSLFLLAIFLLIISAAAIRGEWTSTFELYCFYHLKSKKKAVPLIVISLVYIPIFLVSAIWRWVYKRSRTTSSWRSPVEYLISLISFLLMWISLGFYIEIRSEMSDLVGSSYEENQWGFGQLLAVLAWLPTAIAILEIIMWDWIEENVAPKITSIFGLRRDSTATYIGIQEPGTELATGRGP